MVVMIEGGWVQCGNCTLLLWWFTNIEPAGAGEICVDAVLDVGAAEAVRRTSQRKLMMGETYFFDWGTA